MDDGPFANFLVKGTKSADILIVADVIESGTYHFSDDAGFAWAYARSSEDLAGHQPPNPLRQTWVTIFDFEGGNGGDSMRDEKDSGPRRPVILLNFEPDWDSAVWKLDVLIGSATGARGGALCCTWHEHMQRSHSARDSRSTVEEALCCTNAGGRGGWQLMNPLFAAVRFEHLLITKGGGFRFLGSEDSLEAMHSPVSEPTNSGSTGSSNTHQRQGASELERKREHALLQSRNPVLRAPGMVKPSPWRLGLSSCTQRPDQLLGY